MQTMLRSDASKIHPEGFLGPSLEYQQPFYGAMFLTIFFCRRSSRRCGVETEILLKYCESNTSSLKSSITFLIWAPQLEIGPFNVATVPMMLAPLLCVACLVHCWFVAQSLMGRHY